MHAATTAKKCLFPRSVKSRRGFVPLTAAQDDRADPVAILVLSTLDRHGSRVRHQQMARRRSEAGDHDGSRPARHPAHSYDASLCSAHASPARRNGARSGPQVCFILLIVESGTPEKLFASK
jgi:hypothetical protein